ncbi:MAG: SMI1/KNR4 family protein, partial [Candidatus Sericytochromatia bacterium]
MEKELFIYSILSKKPNAEQLNQSDIDKLQKDFNVKLPQDYIDFLLKTNGGDIFISRKKPKARWVINKYIENVFEPGVSLKEFYDLNLILYFLEDTEGAPEYQ